MRLLYLLFTIDFFCFQSDCHRRSSEHRLRVDPQGAKEGQRGQQHGPRRRRQGQSRNSGQKLLPTVNYCFEAFNKT